MKLLLTVFVLFGSAYGDPALVWTGDPVITADDIIGFQGGYSTNETAHSITSNYGCPQAPNPALACMADFTVSRTFTVTSPGLFSLSSFFNVDVSSSDCGPIGCATTEFLQAFATETDGISGPVSFSESVNNGESNFASCGRQGLLGCVSVSFNGSQGNTVNLGLGDYTLDQDFSLTINNFNGAQAEMGAFVNTDLVPAVTIESTPEPKSTFVAVAILFVVLASVRRHLHV
jgi:hypothetical protein